MGIHDAYVNVSRVPDDPALKPWTELCEPCLAAFRKWQCAPNPGAWAVPAVQANPQLLAFLASCRVTGPSPDEWRRTISEQLLLIRRICTDNKDGTHGEYVPLLGGHRINWADERLARDEDGIPCRFCRPAHGTITQLLQCRCAQRCGGRGCTGAEL